jgi:hypothetical protein
VSGQIELIAETKEYRIYGRDACVAMVHFTQSGEGAIGSSGLMTENGVAYLVWRDGSPVLVGKGAETPATPEQVEMLRAFSEDLKKLVTATGV